MSDRPHVVIKATRAVARDFRVLLEREKFLGADLAWVEHRGWFRSEFTVIGAEADLLRVYEAGVALFGEPSSPSA